jgi:hypothetical protein
MSDLAIKLPYPSVGSPPDRTRIVVAVALVVALLAGALTAVTAVKWHRERQAAGRPDRRSTGAQAALATTALAEGGQLAVDFSSFDYRTLSQDFAATATHATSGFAKTYLAQSEVAAPLLKKAKAVAVSQVVATGLQAFSAAKGTATVVVALNVTTKNTKSPGGTIVYYRMQLQLVDQHGHWLASAVTTR